jgi:Tfp pilus assembly PilM family ATPase
MPQYLAIEWDSAECRAAVASIKGRQVVIEHAFAFPRGGGDESPDGLGAKIAQELDARGCGRPEAMVSVGRTRIELRQFTVPPAEEDDLPDLVRFQASREFNELDDRWRLDFLPIEAAGEGPKPVLATAIAPSEIAAIEKVCEVAGLTLRRVLLRPCEAASLLTAGGGGKLPQLVIELFNDEADLTVLQDGKTVFLRTTRFAGGRPAVPALVAEIRLTLAAARNQLVTETGESAKIDSLVLFGKENIDVQLAESVKTELGLPVALLDPFAGVKTSPSLASSMPAHAERYAPLLGMLQAELRNTRHAIDFINPRRRPPPVSRRHLWISLAVAAAVLVVGYLIWGRIDHYMLASDVDGMKDRLTSMQAELDGGKKVRLRTAEIRKWVDQDMIWLDEIAGLSRGMPPARDAMLNELTATSGPRGSQMDIKGWTREYGTITKMEEGIRPLAGNMNTKNSHQDSASPRPYVWRFEALVDVEKETDKGAAKTPSKPTAAATSAPASSTTESPNSSASRSPAGTSAPPAKPSASAPAPSASAATTASPSDKPSATGAAR